MLLNNAVDGSGFGANCGWWDVAMSNVRGGRVAGSGGGGGDISVGVE